MADTADTTSTEIETLEILNKVDRICHHGHTDGAKKGG